MRTIEGYDVKIFTDNVEESAKTLICKTLYISEIYSDSVKMFLVEFYSTDFAGDICSNSR